MDALEFKVRDAASKELASLGICAEDALTKALATSISKEVHVRARALLNNLETRTIKGVESVMTWRAIWVLERIGNEDARAILKELVHGSPGDPAAQEAKAALERLDRKAGMSP